MEESIKKLLRGFKCFQQNYFSDNSTLFNQLKNGQHPKVLVIACSDSRVDPALLTNSNPGDLFVIRNVANLVPPYEPDENKHGVSAALEYAVKILEVESIVIIGHSDCGGIKALMNRDKSKVSSEFIDSWLDVAESAKQLVNSKLQNAPEKIRHQACEEASLVLGLDNILTFPWVKSRLEEHKLSVHAWYFNIEKGVLYYFDVIDKQFQPFEKGL